MTHPLEEIVREAEGFLVIGDSSHDRFPAFSYHAYTSAGKRFYCIDLGGLTESRGATSGGKVYTSVDELPDDVGDLAMIWVHPHTAARAVEYAAAAGCKRVWFSFGTGHREAVARAREMGLQVVEIGRCPLLYLDESPAPCRGHRMMTKVSGLYAKPPQVDENAKRREMI